MSKYAGYFKGKLLNVYPDDYTVVDIETTGLDPISCKIIEISAVKYRCNRKVDEYVTFISIDEKVPDRITKLTGITNDMFRGAPKAAEALSGFINFIGQDILIGHNIAFDLAFLGSEYEDCFGQKLLNNYVDVLKIANEKLPFLESHKQIVVAKYFGIKTEGSHRALADCEICNGCYQKLKELCVGYYNAPEKQAELFISTEAMLQQPLSGKKFLFTGVMDSWYINNLKDIVVSLGGMIVNYPTDPLDIVVVGTADTRLLESDGFKNLLEIKKEKPHIAFIKDSTFVKTLLVRKYTTNESNRIEQQTGLF